MNNYKVIESGYGDYIKLTKNEKEVLYIKTNHESCHGMAESLNEMAQQANNAPDLLAALEELVHICLNTDGYNQKVNELYNAQQAIQKAKGE